MSNSNVFISFSLLFFFIPFASSSSFNASHKCSPQQALDLLLFKEGMSMSSKNNIDSYVDYECQDWLGSGYDPIMMNWNKNTDCCTWDGITCNHLTGDVISIDLSCGMLQGILQPNTTLFHLPRLQSLNLAFNDFSHSQLPRKIHRLSDSLIHLNISSCGLTGDIPWEILFLPRLLSLDLSRNDELHILPNVLKNLLQNSTHLRQLLLSDAEIGWVLPTYLNLSPSLKSLNLSHTGLQGKLPDNIFSLPYLEELDLSDNAITGPWPKVNTINDIPLKWLDLSFTHLSGEIPDSFGHLKSLNHLDLSYCGLQGKLPHNIFSLPYLEKLDLSWNNGITGPLPKVNTSNNIPLKWLDLTSTNLSGEIPDSFGHFKSLNYLDLSFCRLQGKLPHNIFSLPYLENIDLSYNQYLTGPLPKVNTSNNIPLKWLDLSFTNLSGEIPDSFGHLKSLNYLDLSECGLVGSLPKSLVNLRHLTTLDLSNNKLNGTFPSFLFPLPLLEELYLVGNMFSGSLAFELYNCRSLKTLSLSGNQFDGKINIGSNPPSFAQLINLTYLDLSDNNFTGLWDLNTLLSSLPNLQTLDLSSSGLIVVSNNGTSYVNHGELRDLRLASCKLTVFPESLRAMKNLTYLDLSSNNIQRRIPEWAQLQLQWDGLQYLNLMSNHLEGPFPPSICNMRNLWMLDISNNSFSGVIPQCLGNITSSLENINVKSNRLQGPFPPYICNMSRLRSLDMSNNNFSGMIPRCFTNITSSLEMVDMGNNHFHGTIPNMYKECGGLEGLILNGNQLQGEVPSSLSKCQSLKVLDLGNNQLNGTFPHWLGDLPELQVLVLKSNKLHGPIETPSTNRSAFLSIRILDLSHNGFVGNLPHKYFQNFNAMKNVGKNNTLPEYMYMTDGKYYSMIIAVKGVEQLFPKLFVGYIILDLSNNKFEGEIPGVIGGLTSIKVLNLSHNILTGQIPNSLGNLLEIESLDLSYNQLTAEIPQSLADITALEVLNLSQNNLVGRIPHGAQFNTFSTSFEGNPKLCGFPLPKKCEHTLETQVQVDGDGDGDEESGFTWKVVMMGYGCGTILGLVMGYLMLSTGRPKWFNAIADAAEHMICTRQNRRRYVYIGK